MGFEKWAEDGRLAAVCNKCSARIRTYAQTPAGACLVAEKSGWLADARGAHGQDVTCAACLIQIEGHTAPSTVARHA